MDDRIELKKEAQIRIIDRCLNALKRSGREITELRIDNNGHSVKG